MLRIIMLLLLLTGPVLARAEVADVHDFDTREEEIRYRNLISELRCPKCQNQNIADSNAPIARDMREEVYRMMLDGAGNEEIIRSLEARFGEFVRYKPKLDSRTFILWFMPAIAVAAGLLVVAGVVLRARRREQNEPVLTEQERARAEKILAGDADGPASGND